MIEKEFFDWIAHLERLYRDELSEDEKDAWFMELQHYDSGLLDRVKDAILEEYRYKRLPSINLIRAKFKAAEAATSIQTTQKFEDTYDLGMYILICEEYLERAVACLKRGETERQRNRVMNLKNDYLYWMQRWRKMSGSTWDSVAFKKRHGIQPQPEPKKPKPKPKPPMLGNLGKPIKEALKDLPENPPF